MIESIVGAAFVLLDGWKRFNEPVRGDSLATYRALHLDSRSSTTALSYFGALALYLASLMTAFALLVMNRDLLEKLTKNQPLIDLGGLGLPIVAALALIVVVQQLKLVSTLESWVRRRNQQRCKAPRQDPNVPHSKSLALPHPLHSTEE